jgi:type IV secretion system protein TrbL
MCSTLNPICDIGTIVGSVGGQVAGSVFDQVSRSFGDAASRVTGWMWTVIGSTTTVDLSGGWFRSTLGITSTLAGVVIVAIFVLELIKAVLRREPGALARAVVGVGTGVLGAAAAVAVIEVLLVATDAVSDGVVRTTGLKGIDQLGTRIAPAALLNNVSAPALVLLLAVGYLIASFMVWALFIARKAMIIVAAVFASVAFSGAASRATAGWVRKWLEFTLAMVFSKLVIVILFTLALSLVGSPGQGMAAVGNLFSGLAMMVLACFAPSMLFRLVHFIGGDVISAHHHGVTSSVVQAGSTPVNLARSAAMPASGRVATSAAASGSSTAPVRGASTVTSGRPVNMPLGKSLVNNPVIKNPPGSGPTAGGGHGPDGDGPRPPRPSPPPTGPPSAPPGPKPQPASIPLRT